MKKFCFTVLIATVFLLGANAQIVVKNDYSTTESSADSQKTTENDKDRLYGLFTLGFYGFDGSENYGVSGQFLKPNGFAGEFAFRLDFKNSAGCFDFGPNYSFKLWGKEKTKLLLTAAVGPTIAWREVYNYSFDSKGNLKEDSKTKVFCDMFANVRLGFVAGRFALSVGYFMWAPKFKMGKDYRADGYSITVGWDLW